MRVLIIVDIWYNTVALDALKTGGVLEASNALEAIAAEKELTNLQTRIMGQ
ncbi:hypothetical protein G9A89_013732 [Geosiphon pyriformis]|nr:hypothetical protein G9A89_013732 [Geosiphon pyriformis]